MKSYTDLEQSKKLAEILPLESADMHYVLIDSDKNQYDAGLGKYIGILPHYPCWSFAALISILRIFTKPTAFSVKVSTPSLIKTENGYKLTYTGDYTPVINNGSDIESPIESTSDNAIDCCVDMIIKLKELNLL